MNEFITGFHQGLAETSWLEWTVTFTAICYVVLAALKNIWCWLFALISSVIAVYIYIEVKLYVESFLNFFYVIMALVGYFMWNKDKSDNSPIRKWPLKWHFINIGACLFLAGTLGFVLSVYTDQQQPYVDSFTTVFALTATFLVSKKILSNWIYWIIIDAVSVYLCMSRGLELLAVLNFLYTVLAAYGWIRWNREFKLQIK